MRLISLQLEGQYKGLANQVFDFSDTRGNIIALIGLNGSGKSQLLELVAEVFGYLERYLRVDFKCRDWFPNVEIELRYNNQPYDSEKVIDDYWIRIDSKGSISITRNGSWLEINDIDKTTLEDEILPSQVVGYSSGLNENLQRPFMKNAVQYLDVMNVKRSWELRIKDINETRNQIGKNLNEKDLESLERKYTIAHEYYQSRYPGIFPTLQSDTLLSEHTELGIRPTALPRLKYFDQDTTALMLVSMGMMTDEIQQDIWKGKQRFNKIDSVQLIYDLRKFAFDSGALQDIAKLISCLGQNNTEYFEPLPRTSKTTEEFYNQFELDYLAGTITIDFMDNRIRETLHDSFFTPEILFEKLYRLQMLASEYWQADTKRSLRKDSFINSAKRPQKWKSPIQVASLRLSDGTRSIEFDDLSDGEAQLIQILSMSYIYKESRALFLLDEPETHLNPSWRTYFHSFIEEVIGTENKHAQALISTHSPFMISSLRRENVYQFERNIDGLINMKMAQHETYGASFDVLIKDLFELRSLISQSVIDEIREQLKNDDEQAIAWIRENLGLSPEKAYLLKKLSK